MMRRTVEFPIVGTEGFAFPFPYGCGEKSGWNNERCWRPAHHRGMHRNFQGTHKWAAVERYEIEDPTAEDNEWLRALASLFRPRTNRDVLDFRCPLERGHE